MLNQVLCDPLEGMMLYISLLKNELSVYVVYKTYICEQENGVVKVIKLPFRTQHIPKQVSNNLMALAG
jgi:hypothetical protein